VLLALIVLSSLVGALWTLWERSRHDPWLRLLERATRRLAGAGWPVPPGSPPRSMAALVRQRWGADDARAQALGSWLLRLEALRYAPAGSSDATLPALRREFDQLPWPR
jgi:hypothetical protein